MSHEGLQSLGQAYGKKVDQLDFAQSCMLSCTSPWLLAALLSKLSAADSCGGVPAPQDQEPRSQILKWGGVACGS